MTRVVSSMFALFFSIVLLISGNAFLMTLLGLRLSLEQFSTATIGWVLVFYSVGFVIGTLYANRIIRRAGHIRAFAAFAALLSCATLAYPMAVEPTFWGGLRIVSGFAMAGLMIVIESWISSSATNANRGALFAVYQVVFLLSTAAGQLMINVGDPSLFIPFSLAAILVTSALIPLSVTRMQAPPIEDSVRVPVSSLYQVAATGLGGAFIGGMLISAFYAMGPVYANQIGLETRQIGNFMASAILAAMLLAWPIGRICDRFDRRRVMMATALVAAGASLITAVFAQWSAMTAMVATGIFVGLTASVYPIAVAITNDRMESSEIVGASTTLLLVYGIGACIGPIVSAMAMDVLGPAGLFISNAIFLVLLASYVANRVRHTPDIPIEDQEAYVYTSPEATLGMAEMDPRHHPDSARITDEDLEWDLLWKNEP